MNVEQFKTEIIVGMRHWFFHSSHPALRFTSEDFLLRHPRYDVSVAIRKAAIEELIAEGKIKRRWLKREGEKGFMVLDLLPFD